MSKQSPLQKFEAMAQQLIEGSFNRFFSGGLALADIAAALARAVEDSSINGQVSGQYDIRLNPADFERIRKAEPDVAAQLTAYLKKLVLQADLTLVGQAHITLLADPAIFARELTVVPRWVERPSAQEVTQIRQTPEEASASAAEIAALDAYLIVDGKRHVPLAKPVISLGRSVENDVVLDVPSVSRQHAQIRWRYGRFILYDVSNRGRTLVNSQPVNETVLKSGDVISLSSVKLIYGEGETQQYPRPRSASGLNDETQIRPPSNS